MPVLLIEVTRMKKDMEEELARSLEQNRQEMMNMETSWQQRLQESEQKIIIVRPTPCPLGGHTVFKPLGDHSNITPHGVILLLHNIYRENKKKRRGKKLVKLFLIFGTSMKTLS